MVLSAVLVLVIVQDMASAMLGEAAAVPVRYRVSLPWNVTPILKDWLVSEIATGPASALK